MNQKGLLKWEDCIVGNKYRLLAYKNNEVFIDKLYTFHKFMDSRDCTTSTTTKYTLWFYSGFDYIYDIMYVQLYIDGSVFIYGDDSRLYGIAVNCSVQLECLDEEYVIVEEEEWIVLDVEIRTN